MADAYYYESVHVPGVASEEVTAVILTSTEEEHKHIQGIAFVEDTGTEQHDAELVMYIEREKIVDAPISQNLRSWDSDVRLNYDPFYPLNQDLPVGQSFKVGHVSGTTASDIYYTVRYTIGK